MKKQEKSQSKEINKAVRILKKGGVIIFPTDTVFGIGCLASNKKAIARIKKIKSSNQNFPILITDIAQVESVGIMNSTAQQLAHSYWPGGLTLVIQGKNGKTVGVRMPKSELILSVIDAVGEPIVGTSANFHGESAPTKHDDINPKLSELVDFVLGGDCISNKESTVIDTTVTPVKILRQGSVKINETIN